MARIRTLKPDFWTDEKVVELSFPARLLYLGTWNFVDDDGRGEYSPQKLKMQILPADPVNAVELMEEIADKGLIQIYEVENKKYFVVCGFPKHQKIDKRFASKLPPPPLTSPEPRRLPPTSLAGIGIGKGIGKDKEKRTMSDSSHKKNGSHPTVCSFSLETCNEIWKSIPQARRVGKKETFEALKKLKPPPETVERIKAYFQHYYRIKAGYDEAGEFFAEMQHPVRVIKHRRYEDELVPCTKKPKAKREDEWDTVYVDKKAYEEALARGETNIRFDPYG